MKKTAPTDLGACMLEGGQEDILQILVETGYHSCLTTFPIHEEAKSIFGGWWNCSPRGRNPFCGWAGNAHARRARMHK